MLMGKCEHSENKNEKWRVGWVQSTTGCWGTAGAPGEVVPKEGLQAAVWACFREHRGHYGVLSQRVTE